MLLSQLSMAAAFRAGSSVQRKGCSWLLKRLSSSLGRLAGKRRCRVKPSGLAVLLPQAGVHCGPRAFVPTASTGTGLLLALKAQWGVCSVWDPAFKWALPVLHRLPWPMQAAGRVRFTASPVLVGALPPGPEAPHRSRCTAPSSQVLLICSHCRAKATPGPGVTERSPGWTRRMHSAGAEVEGHLAEATLPQALCPCCTLSSSLHPPC